MGQPEWGAACTRALSRGHRSFEEIDRDPAYRARLVEPRYPSIRTRPLRRVAKIVRAGGAARIVRSGDLAEPRRCAARLEDARRERCVRTVDRGVARDAGDESKQCADARTDRALPCEEWPGRGRPNGDPSCARDRS